MAQPTLLTQPFAANGDKNVIPNTTAVQGAFSQDKGFPAECSLPLGAGGVAPSRQDFNGAFNMLSSLMYYTQKGYTWHWEAGQEYFVDCVVVDDTDGKMYRCINNVAAGGSAPSTDSVNWKLDTVDLSSQANIDLSNLSATGNARLIPINGAVVVESYHDADGNWWRKYSDGWIEQGGILPEAGYANKTITLLKEMADTKYTVLLCNGYSSRMNEMNAVYYKTTTTFQATNILVSGGFGNWFACGMGAEV